MHLLRTRWPQNPSGAATQLREEFTLFEGQASDVGPGELPTIEPVSLPGVGPGEILQASRGGLTSAA